MGANRRRWTGILFVGALGNDDFSLETRRADKLINYGTRGFQSFFSSSFLNTHYVVKPRYYMKVSAYVPHEWPMTSLENTLEVIRDRKPPSVAPETDVSARVTQLSLSFLRFRRKLGSYLVFFFFRCSGWCLVIGRFVPIKFWFVGDSDWSSVLRVPHLLSFIPTPPSHSGHPRPQDTTLSNCTQCMRGRGKERVQYGNLGLDGF